MTPQRFAQHVRADLRARRWLRWHCMLIGALTLLTAWACSHALMRLGTDALWLRYGISFDVAYVVFLLLLYVWARWPTRPAPRAGWARRGGARARPR